MGRLSMFSNYYLTAWDFFHQLKLTEPGVVQIPEQISYRFDDILADKSLSKSHRGSLLEEAAADAWNAIFPEGAHRLPESVVMQRWDQVLEQLSQNPNREKILRIIESQASGERFYWLDSPDAG